MARSFDKTDGVTIETALTITNERITLTADTDDGNAPTNILDNVTGATSGTANDLNYITGNDAGMMQLELSAANVNRLGRLLLSITDAANHVPVFHEFMVLPAMIYDAFVLGTDTLDASVTQWLGTAASTPTVAGVPNVNAKTWNDLATGARPLGPTTAGRTLDVSSGGEAGVDWANVGSPTTTVGLSGTTVKTATDVETDTQDLQSRLPAALSSGNLKADVFAMQSGVVTATAIAADAIGASELAADAVTEIKNAILSDGTAFAGANLDAAVSTRATPAQILTTALTEGYATDGAAFTLSQALYMLWSALSEFAISSTTITCKKLDGSTTAMEFTLDSATAPTARTRAA